MTLPWGFGSFDRVVFGLLNRTWTSSFLDAVVPAITDLHKTKWVLYGAAPAALAFWLYKGRKNALRVLVVAAIAIGVSDFLCYRVIKPYVARERPPYAGIGAQVRCDVGGRNGFPSNHAVNAGAAASVLGVAYPPLSWLFWSIALLIGYTRVYCGVHYPGDVLAGLLLGGAIGWPWALLMLGGKGASAGSGKKKKR